MVSVYQEMVEAQDTSGSVYTIVATDPADFCEEHWGSQECAGKHPFDNCDERFNEGTTDCNADEEHDEPDFCQGD
jgi:hypothetical protein